VALLVFQFARIAQNLVADLSAFRALPVISYHLK